MSKNTDYSELKKKLTKDREEAEKKRIEAKINKRKRKNNEKHKYPQIKIKIKAQSPKKNNTMTDTLEPEIESEKENNTNPTSAPSVNTIPEKTNNSLNCSNLGESSKEYEFLLNNDKYKTGTATKCKQSKRIQKNKLALSNKALEEKRRKDRERQRKRRAKMSEEELERKRAYDKKYKEDKIAAGTWKKFRSKMSEREKRIDRKRVRDRVRQCRERKKDMNATVNFLENNTPPGTPSTEDQNQEIIRINPSINSSRSNRGRKKKNLNRSKVYRMLKEAENKLKIALKEKEKYKKRYQRLKRKNTPSPNTKINRLAEGRAVPEGVRKRLLFTESVTEAVIKQKQTLSKNRKDLSIFHNVIASDVIKKNKQIMAVSQIISPRAFQRANKGIKRKWKLNRISTEVFRAVVKFYEEDIHSKLLPGKKDYVTHKKIKKQKRLLLHSIKDLHRKYNIMNSKKISYSTFLKLKPFWVVYPKMSDRNTCACVKCSNIELLANRAFHLGILNKNVKDIIKEMVCSIYNKDCMLRQCFKCKNKPVLHNVSNKNKNDNVSYQQWQFVKIKRSLNDDTLVRVTQKNNLNTTKEKLIDILSIELLPEFMAHYFKIYHQYKVLKILKNTLSTNEVYVHMDFSENFETKYHEEVQSMHFGGSKRHLSLHTVIVYFKEEGNLKTKSFCTVSTNTDHGAHAVWAHLSPIFLELSDKCYDTIHIQSDGPSSQYKNRFNLYFLTNIDIYFKGIKKATWNYSISGHGKGAADGVGGLVKRSADSIIKMGSDIIDVETFINAVYLRTQSVTLYEIPSEKISDMKSNIMRGIPKITQISSLHQVTWTKENPKLLFTRELSCFKCPLNAICIHHKLKEGCVNMQIPLEEENASLDDYHLQETYFNDLDCGSNEIPKTIEEFHPGEWVLFEYEESTYPGEVLGVNMAKEELTINSMEPLPKNANHFRWPKPKDVNKYPLQDIIRKVSPPIPLDKRGVTYKFGDNMLM